MWTITYSCQFCNVIFTYWIQISGPQAVCDHTNYQQFLINWPTVKTNLMKYMQKLEFNMFVRRKNCSASGGSTYRCHYWGFEPPKQVTKCSSSELHWQLPSLTLTPIPWPVQCKIENEALCILQVWQPAQLYCKHARRKKVGAKFNEFLTARTYQQSKSFQ